MADNTYNDNKTVDTTDHTNPMTDVTDETEPATAHDVGIGGGLGAVGGAIVGALAGGPVGAVIGAIAGGAVSAGAVDVVDKRDHDYDRTAGTGYGAAGAGDATTTGYGAAGTGYGTAASPDNAAYAGTGYAGTGTPSYDTTAANTSAYATGADPASEPVSEYAPASDYDTLGYAPRDRDLTDTDAETMRLREEQLRANKQTVSAGEVHIHKDVVTETRSIDVPVTREELVIERHPVAGGQAVADDFDDDADQVIRVPLTSEQVTLEKNTVVTGEVSVGKRQVTETEHLTGEVRREEARIENKGGATVVDGDGATGTDGTF